ncbi:MAG: SMC family ATPase, partial [Treponema sp.]|nr:SMC family ATPase [Treponema sp.]
MKPLKLIITGFEAYINRCEIDFTSFGDGTLYLITGNTGAGKTTIFDAITYALYGEPSGNTRKEKMLRTITAGPEIPTEVDFTFEFKKHKYRIVRNPEYEGLSKNKKTKTITADATLWDSDGNVLESSKSKVTTYIENLLSLTKDQFCRIAMIAQGDFYNVLNAGTKDRKEIYSKIFGTDLFNLLQKRISEETKKARDEREDIIRSKNSAVSEIVIPQDYDEDDFSTQIPDAELNQNLIHLLEHDAKNQKEHDKELEEIKKKIKGAEDMLNNSRNLLQQKHNLEESREKLKIQEEAYATAKDNVDKEMARQPEIDKLNSELTITNESLSKYDALAQKKELLNKSVSMVNSKSKEVEELKKNNGLLSQSIESAKEKINSYSGVDVEIEKIKTARDRISEEGKNL